MAVKTLLPVGVIGYKFMGKAHANAYRQVARFFPDVAYEPALKILCGRDQAAVSEAAEQYGFEGVSTDWRETVAHPDIQLIDVCTAGDTHAAISIEAMKNGKHVFCEKPLANTLDEAKAMLATARQTGMVNMVNFNYRRVPAVLLAKQLIDDGRIGQIYHWRAVYLQDWIMDPAFPMVWRLDKNAAGAGAMGDLGAHIIDLARMLVGELTSVTGLSETFIRQRPVSEGSSQMADVTVDDAALFLARFDSGALGTFEVSRFGKGRLNYNRFEINGSRGSLVFNLERLNELEVYFDDDPPDVRGFRTILATDRSHKYIGAWWPPGHIIGWEHTFTHGVYDLLNGIATGVSPAATFEDGMRCQAVLDAVERSAGSGQWVEPDYAL